MQINFPTTKSIYRLNRITSLTKFYLLLCLLLTNSLATSAQTPVEPQILQPNQSLEREMSGAKTHQYKFDLQPNEFFQVRIEQKGVDIALKLLDKSGNILAAMDSPNDKSGFETLSFVADKADKFVLEVSSADAKINGGKYSIKREITRMATGTDKRRVEVEKSFVEGITARNAGQGELAVKKLEEAVSGWKELNDSYLLDLSVQQINQIKINRYRSDIFGEFYQQLNNSRSALQEGQRLMSRSRADSLSAREKLNNSLQIHRALNLQIKAESETIAKKISQSGEFASQLNDELIVIKFSLKLGEALSLNGIAQTHSNLQEWEANIDYLKQALNVYQVILSDTELKSNKESLISVKAVEAAALAELGGKIDAYLGNSSESIKYLISGAVKYNSLFNETQNTTYKFAEAQTLSRIGLVYGRQAKEYVNSIKYYKKALEIYRAYPDKKYEIASTLDLIGTRQSINFEYQPALENWKTALQNYREINYKLGQSSIFHSISLMYWVLNNKSKLAETVNQWLDILQSPDFVENTKQQMNLGRFEVLNEIFGEDIESTRLSRIALAYRFIENYPKALEYQEKSLSAVKNKGNPSEIRYNLYSLGLISSKLGKWDDAVKYYKSTLDISRQQGVKEEIADDLTDVGWVLLETGKPDEALKYQNEAFLIYQSVGVNENGIFVPKYTNLLNETSRSHYALGNKRLAIFYGKRAVNAMQGERRRLQNLDLASQKGFLERKEKDYRRLADWLIEDGRLLEAQAVLDLLKGDEFNALLRRGTAAGENIPYSTSETTAISVLERVSSLGREKGSLAEKNKNGSLTEVEKQRFRLIDKDIEIAEAEFNKSLAVLSAEKNKGQNFDIVVKDTQAFMADLKDLGKGTVALYTVIVNDPKSSEGDGGSSAKNENETVKTGWIILVTPEFRKQYPIDVKDLEKTISTFREALRSDQYNPQPVAELLYKKIFRQEGRDRKTLEADLDEYFSDKPEKTLMWSLDGILRYVPMAALHDGKNYLVEKYRTTMFNSQSKARLKDVPQTKWTVLGLGVSEARQEAGKNFPKIEGARRELQAIVLEKGVAKDEGILPGKIEIDSQFTADQMRDALAFDKNPVVHIASHFNYDITDVDGSKSFLLLGKGKLTVQEMNVKSTLFADVDLLALSACDTAMGGGNGKEVEGFAFLAQNLGAKSVLASLWQVSDTGTDELMIRFYKLRTENPKMSKGEAFRQAQLSLLGAGVKNAIVSDVNRSEVVDLSGEKIELPMFEKDAKRPFAHPHYWSSFVLIGNWK